jgi:hypothetical protein
MMLNRRVIAQPRRIYSLRGLGAAATQSDIAKAESLYAQLGHSLSCQTFSTAYPGSTGNYEQTLCQVDNGTGDLIDPTLTAGMTVAQVAASLGISASGPGTTLSDATGPGNTPVSPVWSTPVALPTQVPVSVPSSGAPAIQTAPAVQTSAQAITQAANSAPLNTSAPPPASPPASSWMSATWAIAAAMIGAAFLLFGGSADA